jgi:hypothetical protein
MMEVIEHNELWKNVGEDMEYSHTKVILRKASQYFYARTSRRYRPHETICPQDLEVHSIPAVDIWPPFPNDLTAAPDPLSAHCYVKSPSLIDYAEDDDFRPRDSLLEEAQICEILLKYPHPNIAKYRGCMVRTATNHITGLCFVRYETTLAERLKDQRRPFNRVTCLAGIEMGIQHLHSLGLIHNDINPRNIMFQADDTPVIIDFDSCRREGEKLSKGGTWGWCDENARFASPENDYYGLQKIQEALFLRNQ